MERHYFNKELLVLKIAAENRPKGGQLLAYPVGEMRKKYCGDVYEENPNFVTLVFNKELLNIFVPDMKFHIEFTVNRLNLKTQHRAVDIAVRSGLAPVLFPAAPQSSAPQQTLPKLKLLGVNPEQIQPVQHIVAGSSKPAPYIVFGPPGTGKTATLVETIKQIIKCQPQSCILACAPTNIAVDLICESLLKCMDQSKVYRIYAKTHNTQDVPENLKDCSNLVGKAFKFPRDIEDLKSVNITTLLTSSRFVTDKFPQGSFTHVFVDDAGQAEETKCILPLAGLLHPESGQVVLAGDPKQLKPIIRSPLAQRFGRGLSLLERLMTDVPLYQNMFDNRFITKLRCNYRSHPAILKVPNELFYDRELLACAEENQRNSCCSFGFLPQKDFPIIFHEVTGSNTTKQSSGFSFFNTAEVKVLMGYVRKLCEENVPPQDIGIIAPFWKQVQKIQKALKEIQKDYRKYMSSLKVGTVESFQSQERRVILVSTVCSSQPFFGNDKFNVALTRAKALLIVVGNTKVLKSDPNWQQ
ncbi:hypothetical protein WMY93_027396 [Mugilogobius chulae]|uniref:RNA helicase n=1 Tax=Mugilogobius chulae TaxID=88201 RepID=A0AAW0MSV2_9GOBI